MRKQVKSKKTSKKKQKDNHKPKLNDNQLIAIWGSPSSGKTTLSAKIAQELADKKKNVIIIHDDIFCPTIPILLPTIKDTDKSLGKIFSNPVIDQEMILDNSISIKHNDYIALIGHQKVENPFTYSEYTKERVTDLLILLRHLVDYIIVDCSSILTESILTITALELADKVIRLSTADFKGLSYFKSTLPLLMDQKFNSENHLRIVSNTKDYQGSEIVNDLLRGSNIFIPSSFEIEEQFVEGRLFESLRDKSSIKYKDELAKIMEVVFYE